MVPIVYRDCSAATAFTMMKTTTEYSSRRNPHYGYFCWILCFLPFVTRSGCSINLIFLKLVCVVGFTTESRSRFVPHFAVVTRLLLREGTGTWFTHPKRLLSGHGLFRFRHSYLRSVPDNIDEELQRLNETLARMQNQERQQQIQSSTSSQLKMKNFQESPEWLSSLRSLPFECTECGKCCRTTGDVYMSPSEIAQAVGLLQANITDGGSSLSIYSFIEQYASHTITARDGKSIWVRLREHPERGDCIFLQDGKFCQIYQARPAQCRTYPFWPSILRSPQTWNDECRRKDDEEDGPTSHGLPTWNPEAGGCEGMKPISLSSQPSSTHSGHNEGVEEVELNGVTVQMVYRMLREYELSEAAFPIHSTEVPVNPVG